MATNTVKVLFVPICSQACFRKPDFRSAELEPCFLRECVIVERQANEMRQVRKRYHNRKLGSRAVFPSKRTAGRAYLMQVPVYRSNSVSLEKSHLVLDLRSNDRARR